MCSSASTVPKHHPRLLPRTRALLPVLRHTVLPCAPLLVDELRDAQLNQHRMTISCLAAVSPHSSLFPWTGTLHVCTPNPKCPASSTRMLTHPMGLLASRLAPWVTGINLPLSPSPPLPHTPSCWQNTASGSSLVGCPWSAPRCSSIFNPASMDQILPKVSLWYLSNPLQVLGPQPLQASSLSSLHFPDIWQTCPPGLPGTIPNSSLTALLTPTLHCPLALPEWLLEIIDLI